MPNLIDADALKQSLGIEGAKKYGNETELEMERSYKEFLAYEIADEIDGMDVVDAVEVVRCKDCAMGRPEHFSRTPSEIYCARTCGYMSESGYCSQGKRREAPSEDR